MRYLLALLPLIFMLNACISGTDSSAPVITGSQQAKERDFYRVQPGDTLYSIAWNFGVDYRQLVDVNHINPPYKIHRGQLLKLVPHDAAPTVNESVNTYAASRPISHQFNQQSIAVAQPAVPRIAETSSKPVKSLTQPAELQYTAVSGWNWPTRGPVIGQFSAVNKGIDIAGKEGQPVMTTAPGVVVYAGNGLRGYGKLIIIKHNAAYLTAYAHNKDIVVKEGQRVRAKQTIAHMGSTGTNRVKLHFEIRHNGKPIDPMRFLSIKR